MWFPGWGEEEEGFGLGGSCCLLFCDGIATGGWGKARRENGESGVRLLLQDFSRLFWVGFLGVSDRRQVQTDSSDQ